MNTHFNDDRDIQAALAEAPMAKPSDELLRKLRISARETAPRRTWWRARLLPGALAVAAVALVVGVALTPAKASAKTFELVQAATARVHVFQFFVNSDEAGKPQRLNIIGVNGRVAICGPQGELIRLERGGMSVYDPSEKRIIHFKFSGLPGTENMKDGVGQALADAVKEMDLQKMLADYRKRYGEQGIAISPVTRENGESVYHMTLAAPDEPERVEMTVDAATDLPERLQILPKNGGKATLDMTMRFGEKVDPNLLNLDFPKNIPVEEIDLGNVTKGLYEGKVGKAEKSKAGH